MTWVSTLTFDLQFLWLYLAFTLCQAQEQQWDIVENMGGGSWFAENLQASGMQIVMIRGIVLISPGRMAELNPEGWVGIGLV